MHLWRFACQWTRAFLAYIRSNQYSFPLFRPIARRSLRTHVLRLDVALECSKAGVRSATCRVPRHCVGVDDVGTMTCIQVTLRPRSEEHTSELQSHVNLVCR